MNATLEFRNFDNIKKSLRFLKQEKNWDEIFKEAFEEWRVEIENTAKELLGRKINDVTGKLRDSIYTIIDEDGDLAIKSYHKAAQIIDKGGFSKFPNWNSQTIKQYAKEYNQSPFVVARGIFQNQPFQEATMFSWGALFYHKENIKDEIFIIARKRKDEAVASGTY